MDWKEVLGAVGAGFVLLIPAVKWLISDWAKKAEEIEALKSRNTSKSIERFEEDLKGFRGSVDGVKSELRQHSELLIKTQGKLQNFEEKLFESKQVIEAHSLNLAGNIRQLIRTELVTLSKDAKLIRDKKNGKT